MGVYASLTREAQRKVDTTFRNTPEGDIVGMGLPDPMKLRQTAQIVYHGNEQRQEAVLGDFRVWVAVRRRLGRDLSISEIASELDRPDQTIREWMDGVKPGTLGDLGKISEYEIPASVEYSI